MRFTRQAGNKVRLHGLTTREAVEAITDDSGWISMDPNGNIVPAGFVEGRRVTVVLAADELDLVITIHGGRRRRR